MKPKDHETLNSLLADRIMSAVDKNFPRQLAQLRDLVRIPSQRGAESAAQRFMAQAYEARGYKVDHWKINLRDIENMPGFSPATASYDDSYNVVATHTPRQAVGRSLILNGHIDVVPIGPVESWSLDPYSADIIDGWLYGRGAGDMKSGLLACLAAMDALRIAGVQPAAIVHLQSVVEEECTGNGALACLARGYHADAAFIPEPLLPKLMRAQVGPLWFKVQVKGDPQHASGAFSGTGSNAIENAIYLIKELGKLELLWNERKLEHPHFCGHPHPINFNLGKISGGDWPSSVPAWCDFEMRVAVYPGQSLDSAKSEIEAFIAAAASNHPFLATHKPDIYYHGFMAEGYVLENSDEVEQALNSAHQLVFHEPLQEYVTAAATDARFFGLYADTPAIVYGPECKMPHGYDEAVNIESLRQVTKTIALFIATWCGVEEFL